MRTRGIVSVFGLGKLGLPFAVSWASRGFHVIGVDVRPDILRGVEYGNVDGAEPPVASMLASSKQRVRTTGDPIEAVERSDVSFVVVPTPSNEVGGYSTRYVEDVLEKIGLALKKKDEYHLVSIVSTVLPGACDSQFRPLLERLSGKVCGRDFGLCYNPEFIALGEVVIGLLRPDFVLIGESDPSSGAMLEEMYTHLCENRPPIVRMSLWNAELAKISLNVYVTMKISFANTLAELCEKIPGGDVDIVSQAIGLDSRIGTKYLKGGLGYGGPCFPRDNRAFSHIAGQLGNSALLSRATDEINEDHAKILSNKILGYLNGIEKPQISILGLTYKPNTFVVEESAAIHMARSLADNGALVKAYDPAGTDHAKRLLGDTVQFAPSTLDCLEESDFCIIATPWKQFQDLSPSVFLNKMRHPRILDCWRILDRTKFQAEPKLRYFAVGVNGPSPW